MSSVRLSWQAVAGATGYRVYGSNDGQNFTPLATVTGLTYTHDAGHTERWWYRITSFNDQWESRPSVAIAPANWPPTWPAPFTLTGTAGQQIDISGYAADRDSPGKTFAIVAPIPSGYSMTTAGMLTLGTLSQNLTLSVSDGSLTATTTVQVAIAAKPTPPSAVATYIIPASTAGRTFDFDSSTGFDGGAWKTVGGVTRLPQPGDIVELAPGTHGPLKFRDITGTSTNRITLRGPQTNGQRAIVRRTTPSAGGFIIEFYRCVHFNFDGYQPTLANNESGAYQCGIKVMYAVNASTTNFDNPSMWVKWTPVPSGTSLGPCHSYTVRYIDIDGGWRSVNSFGAGFYFHSVNTAHQRTQYPGQWIAENVVFEYNWTRRLRNGYYLGPNYIESGDVRPCLCRNITVRYNRCEYIAGAAIHVKCWVEGDNSIHHNYVRQAGMNWEMFDGEQSNTRNGIDIINTTARVYNNYIHDVGDGGAYDGVNSKPNGLQAWAADIPVNAVTNGYGPYPYFETRIYNNHISKVMYHGISSSKLNAASTPFRHYIYNNTVYDCYLQGLNVSGTDGGWIRNCIVLGYNQPNVIGPSNAYNTLTGTPSDIFVSPSTYNLHLKAALLATGTIGTDVPADDLDNKPRTQNTADRGCYEYP